jgi:hypothetical protein
MGIYLHALILLPCLKLDHSHSSHSFQFFLPSNPSMSHLMVHNHGYLHSIIK